MRTPVDTGRARGNWQVTIDMPARGEANVGDPVSAGRGVIDKSPAFCTIWITNTVPYITVLEYGLFDPENPGPNKHGQVLVSGGFSVQAPHGMVGVTLGELRAMF